MPAPPQLIFERLRCDRFLIFNLCVRAPWGGRVLFAFALPDRLFLGFQGRKIVADPLYLLPTSQAQA